MKCPDCDHLVDLVGMAGGWRVYHCAACDRRFDEIDARIERRGCELFAGMFPAGSDGPGSGFDMGDLYIQAGEDVIDQIRRDHEHEIDRIQHKAEPD